MKHNIERFILHFIILFFAAGLFASGCDVDKGFNLIDFPTNTETEDAGDLVLPEGDGVNLAPTHGAPSLISIVQLGPTQEVNGVLSNINDGDVVTYHGFYSAVLDYVGADCKIEAAWSITLPEAFYVGSVDVYLYLLSQNKTVTWDWHTAKPSSYVVSVFNGSVKIAEISGSLSPTGDQTLSVPIYSMATTVIVSINTPNAVFSNALARNYMQLKEIVINGEEWVVSNGKYRTQTKTYRMLKMLSADGALRRFDGTEITCPALCASSHPMATPRHICMMDGVKSYAGYSE